MFARWAQHSSRLENAIGLDWVNMSRNELTELMLGKEISIRFVSIAEAVSLHDQSIDKVGGTAGVRDLDLLESALHKPMHQCVYAEDYDLYSLAAILADGIAQNHAFMDGNKRTAFLSCILFLKVNDIDFEPDVAEAIDTFRRLASHDVDVPYLASWIRKSVDEADALNALRASVKHTG